MNTESLSWTNFALFLLLVSVGWAQGNSNGRVTWQTYSTEHFKILFHPEVKQQADLAQVFLEQAYARISADLGHRDKGILINVVLTGLPDDANGSATPLGHTIIIYTRPAQVLGGPEIAWLKRVLAHELTHQLSFLTLRNPLWGFYSEYYKVSKMPAWFIEGLAQYEAETWDAKRNTFFAYALYNSALEPYPNLATFVKSDPVSGRLVYEQGHAFIRFLVHRQGKGFIKKLMKSITVIPLWTEFKAILSPLTRSYLPLESAIRKQTGLTIGVLYREFLDSLQAGLPKNIAPLPKPMMGVVPGFALIFQTKSVAVGDFVFTAQESWDKPVVALYRFHQGIAQKIGPDFVNPVFDLSADGRQVLYVRTYQDPYSDRVEKLFLHDLGTGKTQWISDGASHPIFLGPDSIAFSHYRQGKQALTFCSLNNALSSDTKPVCRELKTDSLAGFYALSRSSVGLLCNATDTSGRTGVYAYSSTQGMTQVFSDSLGGEFPVEAKDSSIWMIRDRQGLGQVEAFNLVTKEFHSIANYPLGTFYLHQTGQGQIASLVQTGERGYWSMAPVEAISRVPDTVEISIPAFVAPSFLLTPIPNFDTLKISGTTSLPQIYYPLLGLRPLIFWPGIYQDYPSGNFGGTMILKDPLGIHEILVVGSPFTNEAVYDLTYTNKTLPVAWVFRANNMQQIVSKFLPPPGWRELFLVERISHYSLQLLIPAPWDMPVYQRLYLGITSDIRKQAYTMAGSLEPMLSTAKPKVKILDAWWYDKIDFISRVLIGYSHERPNSYSTVHPLFKTDLQYEFSESYPDFGQDHYAYIRQTLPLWRDLTFTLWYEGQWQANPFTTTPYALPDGRENFFYSTGAKGQDHDLFTSYDFPIHKGYLMELPLFGLWNYLGGSFFTGIGQSTYDDSPGYSGSGLSESRFSMGTKLVFLFHPARNVPLVMSQSAQYDFVDKGMKYRTQVEFSGLPQSYSLLPHASHDDYLRNNPLP